MENKYATFMTLDVFKYKTLPYFEKLLSKILKLSKKDVFLEFQWQRKIHCKYLKYIAIFDSWSNPEND